MHCITELACELLDTQSNPSCASQRATHPLACVCCFEHLPKVDCMQGMTAARCATAAHKPDIAKMLETRIHKVKRPTGGTSGRTRQADAVQTAPPAFSPAIIAFLCRLSPPAKPNHDCNSMPCLLLIFQTGNKQLALSSSSHVLRYKLVSGAWKLLHHHGSTILT